MAVSTTRKTVERVKFASWAPTTDQRTFGGNPNWIAPDDLADARDDGFSDKRAKLTPSIVQAAQQAHAVDPKANSVAKLAKRYGVTRMTMHRAIARGAEWGKRGANHMLNERDREHLREMYSCGKTTHEDWAQRFGISEDSVRAILGYDDRLERFAAKVVKKLERRLDEIDDAADEPTYRLD